jgi:hypothetical protein
MRGWKKFQPRFFCLNSTLDKNPTKHNSLIAMKMKWIIVGLLAIATMFFAFVFWYRWDSETNHGLTFGYWRAYNNISNSIAQLPGVTIVGTGYNADVTLEEFGFDVKDQNSRVLKIWFNEEDPIRKMTGDQLKSALTKKINEAPSTPVGK